MGRRETERSREGTFAKGDGGENVREGTFAKGDGGQNVRERMFAKGDLQGHRMYQKFALELSYREIAMNLNVDASTVQRVVQRFEDTGAVEKVEYPKGHNDDLRRRLTKVDEHLIIHLVLIHPSIYLHEVQQELTITTGTHVSIPTM